MTRPAAEVAGGVAVEPVAWLRFRSVLIAPDDGHEFLEVCQPHEVGDDGSPAVPVYATPTPRPVGLSEAEALRRFTNTLSLDGTPRLIDAWNALYDSRGAE